jgi:hypothetical protein
MVHHTVQVGRLRDEQRCQDTPVELHPPDRRHGGFDRTSRQLVVERHRVRTNLQDALPLGIGEIPEAAEQRPGQGRLNAGRDDGQLLERPLGRWLEPVQARGPRRRPSPARCPAGRPAPLRRRGCPPGEPVQPGGGDGRFPRQARHGGARQPPQHDAPRCSAGQHAEDPAQRMIKADLVVAVSDHDDGREVGDPPPHMSHHVEGRLVRPVRVLHDEHRRSERVGQRLENRVEHRLTVATGECRGERLTDPCPPQAAGTSTRTRHQPRLASAPALLFGEPGAVRRNSARPSSPQPRPRVRRRGGSYRRGTRPAEGRHRPCGAANDQTRIEERVAGDRFTSPSRRPRRPVGPSVSASCATVVRSMWVRRASRESS